MTSPLTDEQANKIAWNIAQTATNIYLRVEVELGRKLEQEERDAAYEHVTRVGDIFKCQECHLWKANSEKDTDDCCCECAEELDGD